MDIKDFLARDEIKELIAQNDLEAVYRKYHYPDYECGKISDYLFDLGIDPLAYFTSSIPDFAFRGCNNLTSVTIPNGITTIGYCAFDRCESLTSIVIPDSVTTIGDRAFEYCYSLTSIVIPDSVTSIDDYAFFGCTSLASVIIPDSVTSIGEYAFQNCTGLTNINYTGTRAQWKKIEKDQSWKVGSSLSVLHCKDGNILV